MKNRVLPGKYLVLGSSGLIGTSVLNLLKDQEDVSVAAIYFNNEPIVRASNIEHIQFDLRERGKCEQILGGVDYVVHLASNIVVKLLDETRVVERVTSNILMNTNILESVYYSDVKKILWVSSSTGYPRSSSFLHEEDMFISDPGDEYFAVGWSNRFVEKMLQTYSLKMNRHLSVAVIRPTCIYGENQRFDPETCPFLPFLVRAILENSFIELWDNGEVKRDYLHADDAAVACLMALNKTNHFEVFNIGHGIEYSSNQLVSIICKLAKIDIQVVRGSKVSRNYRRLSLEKSKGLLDLVPNVSMKEGLGRVIRQYRKNNYD